VIILLIGRLGWVFLHANNTVINGPEFFKHLSAVDENANAKICVIAHGRKK
jgi:hypothetical protein